MTIGQALYPGVIKELEWHLWEDQALEDFTTCDWCGHELADLPPGLMFVNEDMSKAAMVCGLCLPEIVPWP